MKMFSFSRSNERSMGFITSLKSWFSVDISRYDTLNSELLVQQIKIINCLKLWIEIRALSSIVYSYCTEIRRKTSSLLATRSCLVIILWFRYDNYQEKRYKPLNEVWSLNKDSKCYVANIWKIVIEFVKNITRMRQWLYLLMKILLNLRFQNC